MTVDSDRIQRDIEQINAFNATPDRGITRLPFSKEYQKAQAYIIDQLRQIDARISICRRAMKSIGHPAFAEETTANSSYD